MTHPPRLMQAKAAASYLGMSETKLRGLNLPCKIDGGNRVFDRIDLDAYADASQNPEQIIGASLCFIIEIF